MSNHKIIKLTTDWISIDSKFNRDVGDFTLVYLDHHQFFLQLDESQHNFDIKHFLAASEIDHKLELGVLLRLCYFDVFQPNL